MGKADLGVGNRTPVLSNMLATPHWLLTPSPNLTLLPLLLPPPLHLAAFHSSLPGLRGTETAFGPIKVGPWIISVHFLMKGRVRLPRMLPDFVTPCLSHVTGSLRFTRFRS